MSSEDRARHDAAAPELLVATGLAKRYEIYRRPIDRLKQSLWRGRRQFYDEFWALRDTSIRIRRGETIGLIGQNGAGKSTLLQILAGTLTPTLGTMQRQGRLAAILELGAGFNPEFTGRENARLNATLMAIHSANRDSLLSEIEAFADIGEFFDRPVKLYSSGMFARLAFAVAASVDPDILIVDEALSVGDARFQNKCFRRLEELQDRGKAIVFVTHSVDLVVRHCNRALLLDHGRPVVEGVPKDVVHAYLDLLFGGRKSVAAPPAGGVKEAGGQAAAQAQEPLSAFVRSDDPTDRLHLAPGYNNNEYRWGHGGARIVDAAILAGGSQRPSTILHADETVRIALRVLFERACASVIIGLTIKTPDGVGVAGTNSRVWDGKGTAIAVAPGDVRCFVFEFVPRLGSGDYVASLGVAEDAEGEVRPLDRRYDVLAFTIIGSGRTAGLADIGITFETADAIAYAA